MSAIAGNTIVTNETRLHFTMVNDEQSATKNRSISVPGLPLGDEAGQQWLAACEAFAKKYTTTKKQFLQYVSFKDNTGASYEDGTEVMTTTAIEAEEFSQTKTRYSFVEDEPTP